jgi:hypothetical protein
MHCSDIKRHIFYIKKDGEWIKENAEKTNIVRMIQYVASKNMYKINDWVRANPNCTESDSNKNKLYLDITLNSMCGFDDDESRNNYKKIINNFSKEIIIHK